MNETTTESAEREVRVGSAAGLHARPAAVVVRAAAQQPVPVMLARPGGVPVSARSILRVLGLDVDQGEEVVVSATGPGAVAAVEHIADLVAAELDEEHEDAREDSPVAGSAQ